jgi:Fur family ferric uptake transcriptional regulator
MSDKLNPNARAQKLRDSGYKLTNARLTVLSVLEGAGGHMTSAQIIEAVAQVDPSIGRASVFRTLDMLSGLAIIRPTFSETSSTPTYVLLPDGHHHHIVCTQCRRVIEFEDCGLAELEKKLQREHRVQLSGHLLEFYGVCDECVAPTGA